MNKKVCMFVWNHFTNDARVLRECTALSEEGYEVDLIAIDDPNDKELQKNETRDGFNIIRVDRYPRYLTAFKGLVIRLKYNKFYLIIAILLYLLMFIGMPNLGIICGILLLLLYYGKSRSILIKLGIIFQMIKYGMKKEYDIYHSNDLNTLPQGYICSKIFRRKKLVYDSHEVQSSRTGYGKGMYYLEKFFVNKVDVMIMTTNTRADYVSGLYKIKKPEVIHNYPFNTGDESIKNKYDLHSIVGIPKDKPILLYQGGIQQGRGLENIIKATPYFEDGTVVFIGDGKLKPTIKKMVKEEKLEDKVKFIDKVPVDELKYYTAGAYLGFQVLNNVCFNHYSALSNKLFEYIMSEIPVVACNFPEIKKVVKGEEVGICVDSHNYIEIADAVNEMLKDKSNYEKYKKNCKRAKEKYNWTNEKKKFTKIYGELIGIKVIEGN